MTHCFHSNDIERERRERRKGGREGGRERGKEEAYQNSGEAKIVNKKMAKMCGHIRSINDRFPKVCSMHSTPTENMHDPD